MISKAELDMKKNEKFMNATQVQELIEYGDTFKLFLAKSINEVQAQLGNCSLQGKEAEAYITINAYRGLIKSIDETEKLYKRYLKEQKNK